MSFIQVIVLGIVQGITEFLPISSSAHLVLVPWIFQWQYQGLTYDVALHLGTLTAIAVYFWRDWYDIIRGAIKKPKGYEGKFLLGLALASVPAAIAGVLLEDAAERIFREPPPIASALILFGLLLGAAQKWGQKRRDMNAMTWKQMLAIGCAQALALIPGVSRSGVTITAALFMGFDRPTAARFSFLLALPITVGAGLMKLRHLQGADITAPFIVGILVSALTGIAAIWLLMSYARGRGFGIFVLYRVMLGILILVLWTGHPTVLKRRLPAENSLNMSMAGSSVNKDLVERLRKHVRVLTEKDEAGQGGERNPYFMQSLIAARDYVLMQLQSFEYIAQTQAYPVKDLPAIADGTEFHNVIAVLPGTLPASEGIYVIGAHYDSAPGTPGADDNASGVAVLLELARIMREHRPAHEIRFVAFSTEEPPSFNTDNMGSRHYANSLKAKGQKVLGMISLEMLGYYREEKGSQIYPPFLDRFFPDRGNFIGLTANLKSHGFLKGFRGAWETHKSELPLVHATLPGFIPATTLSDHWSFVRAGYPALMMTDTAFYRNPHYHEETDTAEKLDYARMAVLTESLTETLKVLAK